MTPEADPRTDHVADLVLEGGGIKGIALTGAVWAFDDDRWTFPRIAGTSAGAIVGSVLAALQAAGEPISQVVELAKTLDYRKFRDRGFPGSWLGPLGALTDPLASLNVLEADFDWATRRLMELADETASGRLVSVLEGGYDLQGLANSVAAHVSALMRG